MCDEFVFIGLLVFYVDDKVVHCVPGPSYGMQGSSYEPRTETMFFHEGIEGKCFGVHCCLEQLFQG